MHAGLFIADSDDASFFCGEFFQPPIDHIVFGELFRKSDIGRVMAGFRFEETFVERCEFTILDVLSQQSEPFAGTGFDQTRDQESINGSRERLTSVFLDPARNLADRGFHVLELLGDGVAAVGVEFDEDHILHHGGDFGAGEEVGLHPLAVGAGVAGEIDQDALVFGLCLCEGAVEVDDVHVVGVERRRVDDAGAEAPVAVAQQQRFVHIHAGLGRHR